MKKLKILAPLFTVVPAIIAALGVEQANLHRPAPAAAPTTRSSAATQFAAQSFTPGSYLGFDTFAYPGDAAMRAWRLSDSPYSWVGFYLPAPCHKDDSWSGTRQRLTDMGWGMAVIYVGQQAWDQIPGHGGRSGVGSSDCSTANLTRARGTQDADDATAQTAAQGFPRGTTIFLDVERVEHLPQALRDYYTAWVKGVLADGRYVPGIYTHTWNADSVHEDVKAVFTAAGIQQEPPFWVANTHDFSPDKVPSEVGHTFADVWQGMIDVVKKVNGVRLPVDVNVAAAPSPSAVYAAE